MDMKALLTQFSETCFLPSMILSRPVSIFNNDQIDDTLSEKITEQEK